MICEDTCGQKKDKDHIRKKNESFQEIRNHLKEFLDWMIETFPDERALVEKYHVDRYQVFYLYIPQNELNLTADERALYEKLLFVEPETLSYFNKMAQCIHHSARYEIFRFLGIKDEHLGNSSSEGAKTTIKAPIIYPEDVTGLRNGVRIVSFMMSAEKLLRNAYVLRKDNWEESIFLYQRLDTVDKSVVLWYNEEKRTGVFLHGEQLSTARYVRCDVGNSQAVHNRKQGNVGRERKGYPSISEWRVLDFENGSTMERPAAGIW